MGRGGVGQCREFLSCEQRRGAMGLCLSQRLDNVIFMAWAPAGVGCVGMGFLCHSLMLKKGWLNHGR